MYFSTLRNQAAGSLVLALVAISSLGGCATRHAHLNDEIVELRKEIKGLRASAAAFRDRIDALEQEQAERAKEIRKQSRVVGGLGALAARSNDDRPALAVVRLAPAVSSNTQASSDTGPRLVLRGNARGTAIVNAETKPSRKRSKNSRSATRWKAANGRRKGRN